MSDVLALALEQIHALQRRVEALERQEYVAQAGVAAAVILTPQAYVADTTSRAFTDQAYTYYTGSEMSVVVPSSGYLWCSYQWSGYSSAVRAASYAAQWYIGATAQGALPIVGADAIGGWRAVSAGLCRSAATVAAGTYAIQLRVYVYTAGDTVTLRYLTGQCFWTKA